MMVNRSKSWRLISLSVLLSATTCCSGQTMLMGRKSELEIVQSMLFSGRISNEHYQTIASLTTERHYEETKDVLEKRAQTSKYRASPGLGSYLDTELDAGKLSSKAHNYLKGLFQLSSSPRSALNAVPANYDTERSNGIVSYLGRTPIGLIQQGNSLGIWGFAKGSREYALQATSSGLRIIDVTVAALPFNVQFIRMSVGYYIWRDVVTHEHTDGRTYAYVHAQSNLFLPFEGELYVIDLSYLSGSRWLPNLLPPIPLKGIRAVNGCNDFGHTIHAQEGYLFVNTATNGDGTLIFDLTEDPWNPRLICQWKGGDGHDVFVRAGWAIPSMGGPRDIMVVSDGLEANHRLFDLTDLRSEFQASNAVVQLSTSSSRFISTVSPSIPENYAHSSVVSADGSTMYVMDEFNAFDIAIFDVSDPTTPVEVRFMQWSGDSDAKNIPVHNMHIRDGYLFAAYYSAGFRVFDISSDPQNPVEVGKYETWRDPHNTNGLYTKPLSEMFMGAWNLYAGLPSGRILCADTLGGTYVLSIDGARSTCWLVCWILRIIDFLIFWN